MFKYIYNLLFAVGLIALPNMTQAIEINTTENREHAVLAGGCFWCIEADMEKLYGIESVVSGYTGGKEPNPTYEQVSKQNTTHTEAILVTFDPSIISYAEIIDKFWLSIDPTVQNRQFCDVGPQYRTGIFYLDNKQKQIAEKSKQDILDSGVLGNATIYTEITKANQFYKAEDYHQNYYKTNPLRYSFYRQSCGRDSRLKEIWGNKIK